MIETERERHIQGETYTEMQTDRERDRQTDRERDRKIERENNQSNHFVKYKLPFLCRLF